MKDIKEACLSVFNAEEDRKIISNFARKRYDEKFGKTPTISKSFHYYDGFEMKSPTLIKVRYTYGVINTSTTSSFLINLDEG